MTDKHRLAGLSRGLYRAECLFMALLLVGMVLIATTQILLRNFFDMGLIWADPLLRVLLLWLGLLGAMAASRDDKHIAIDLLTRLLPARMIPWAKAITSLFTAGVCAVVAYHCARFVIAEYQYRTPAFSGIPAWVLELILPVAFALIALRYLLLALEYGYNARRHGSGA